MADAAWRTLRAVGQAIVRSRLELRVEGRNHLPASGPAIVAARHFHHLYDGCALLATVPRPLHILVALDWVRGRAGRVVMERACGAAAWPVVLRQDGAAAIDPHQAVRALRQATTETLDLLRDGRVVVCFPEGYPNVDPGYTPKTDDAAFLPFQRGVVRLATLSAQRGLPVQIVPAGFTYEHGRRWRVTLRFGEPLFVENRDQEQATLRELETRVRRLSAKGDDT